MVTLIFVNFFKFKLALRDETSKALYQCKLAEGSPVSPHVLKMMGYIENLNRLGYPLSKELATDIILQSLPSSYHQFILNFNMNGLEKSMTELHGILKTAEQNLRKPNDVLLVKKKTNFKKKDKRKAKGKGNGKGKGKIQGGTLNKGKSVANVTESQCFYCNKIGHWKRDCKKFKEDNKKGSGASTSDLDIPVYNIQTKRLKSNDLNSTPLWHCRLGHISEKRIKKLHKEGLLYSFDLESLETCEAYLLGKMTKTPFTGINERANDLLGYALETIAFTLNRVPTKVVEKTQFEMWTGKRPRVSGSNVHLEEIRDTQEDTPTTHEEPQDIVEPIQETLPLRRSDRERRIPQRYLLLISEQRDILLLDNDEPTTFHEAMKKIDMNENVHIHKACLVAKGFKQIHGIDYDETFSPVAMLKSIRILLAIAAYFDYEIWQMDVKTAFLNENLNEDVYMTQPEGFANPNNTRKVCKLQKSIYGLKQASRSWNIRFHEVVKEFGFIKNEEEPCIYKKTSGSALIFRVLYVDDILLIGNNIPLLQSVKSSLKSSFSMKDLGEANYILGIRIYRNRSKRLIGLSQSTYIDKVLKRFNMQDSKRGSLPMSSGISLYKN
ncbi:uncharacterized protein LOC144560202 [Carex rostrata]